MRLWRCRPEHLVRRSDSRAGSAWGRHGSGTDGNTAGLAHFGCKFLQTWSIVVLEVMRRFARGSELGLVLLRARQKDRNRLARLHARL